VPDDGLALEGVTFARHSSRGGEGHTVIDDVTARLPAAATCLVTGPTGAGKSTLLHLLGGLIRPTAGEVRAGGEPISRWVASHRDRWRRNVGMAFQEPRLLEGLSALENVMVPLVPRAAEVGGIDGLRRRAAEALESLAAGDLAGRAVGALSGGERQRVGVARAVVGRPLYLLLDEPTSQQDDEGAGLVLATAREAASSWGAVVVVSSHDPRIVQGAERFEAAFELDRGRLSERP